MIFPVRLVITLGYTKDDSLRNKKRKEIDQLVTYLLFSRLLRKPVFCGNGLHNLEYSEKALFMIYSFAHICKNLNPR